MTSREQFEQFVLELGYPAGYLNRLGDGYSDEDIQPRWIWWQASRAALVVELPVAYTLGEMDYKRDVTTALEAIGVRVTQ